MMIRQIAGTVLALTLCISSTLIGCDGSPEDNALASDLLGRWAESNRSKMADDVNEALTTTRTGLEAFPAGMPMPVVRDSQVSLAAEKKLRGCVMKGKCWLRYDIIASFEHGPDVNRVWYTVVLPGSIQVAFDDSPSFFRHQITYPRQLTIESR